MTKRSMFLAVAVWLSLVSFAMADTTHEAALFIKNAMDPASPIAFWAGDADNPPTFYFHMLHQPWQAGSDPIRSEGAKLLGCVAPIVGVIFQLTTVHLPAWNDSSYSYRVMVSPPPPGGATMVAAEGTVQQGECALDVEAQKLFLHILFPTDKRHAL